MSESASYSRDPDRWAFYMRSKILADEAALGFAREAAVPVTVLRFGILYGPGRAIGGGLLQAGRTICLAGTGKNRLPYTHVQNAVDASLLAAISRDSVGSPYNIVDEPQPTVKEIVRLRAELDHTRSRVVPIPARLLSAFASALEWRSTRRDATRPPRLTRFVVKSATRDRIYQTARARRELGWEPEVALREALVAVAEPRRSI